MAHLVTLKLSTPDFLEVIAKYPMALVAAEPIDDPAPHTAPPVVAAAPPQTTPTAAPVVDTPTKSKFKTHKRHLGRYVRLKDVNVIKEIGDGRIAFRCAAKSAVEFFGKDPGAVVEFQDLLTQVSVDMREGGYSSGSASSSLTYLLDIGLLEKLERRPVVVAASKPLPPGQVSAAEYNAQQRAREKAKGQSTH